MESEPGRSKRVEYTTKVFLTTFFLGSVALFVWWRSSNGQPLAEFRPSTTDLILLAFATLRMGRMIAYDLVMEPLRRPFTRTVKDETGAGDTVEPRGEGVQQAIGQLISCPICAGTWASAFLVFLFYAWPEPARIFITILAVIGAAEVLNAVVEYWCWAGQYGRVRAGAILQGKSTEGHPKE